MKRLWPGLAFILLAGCSSLNSSTELSGDLQRKFGFEPLHQKAPEFQFKDSIGTNHKLADYVGHPVVLHLWATWCTSCKNEIPQLAASAKNWTVDGISFLPVSVDTADRKDDVNSFLNEMRSQVPLYIASENSATKSFWAWGLPVTYLIDKEGVLVARARGMREWKDIPEKELKLALTKP